MNQLFEMYKLALAEDPNAMLANRKRVPIVKSFIAGADPSGIGSFNVGRVASNSTPSQIAGVTGGVVSGVSLLPSAVGGLVSGTKSLLKTHGGLKNRFFGAVKGFARGATSPYKELYHGMASGKALEESKHTGVFTQKAIYHLGKSLGLKPNDNISNVLSNIPKEITQNQSFDNSIDWLKNQIGGRSRMVAMGFGASGGIGGLSAFAQYKQGKEMGNKEMAYNKQMQILKAKKGLR
jgi:hypothetical protein